MFVNKSYCLSVPCNMAALTEHQNTLNSQELYYHHMEGIHCKVQDNSIGQYQESERIHKVQDHKWLLNNHQLCFLDTKQTQSVKLQDYA